MNDTTRHYHLERLQALRPPIVAPPPVIRDEVSYFYENIMNDPTREIVSLGELRAFINMRPAPNLLEYMRAKYSVHQERRYSPSELNNLAGIYALCLAHVTDPNMHPDQFMLFKFNIRFTYRFDDLAQGLINKLSFNPNHILLGLGLLMNYAFIMLDLFCIFDKSSENFKSPDARMAYHLEISAMILPVLLYGQLLIGKKLVPDIDIGKEKALSNINMEMSPFYSGYKALVIELVKELKGEVAPQFFETARLESMRRFIKGSQLIAAPAVGYLGFLASPLWAPAALASLPLTLEACLAAEAGHVPMTRPSLATKLMYTAAVWGTFVGVFIPAYKSDVLHEDIKNNIYCDGEDRCFANAVHTPLAFTLGVMATMVVDYAALKFIHHAPPLENCVQSARNAAEHCMTGASRLCVSLYNRMSGREPIQEPIQNIELGPIVRQNP